MQSLSTCTIITAPLGLSGCHGSPRSNIKYYKSSTPTRIHNISNSCSNFQKTTTSNNNSVTFTSNSSRKSSRMVHSLISSVLQLATNNIIPSSNATNRLDDITKNGNVEFIKLDLQRSATKSLLSEMLSKQVEQRINKNKPPQVQRKPIMILPTKRVKNIENIHTNDQDHNDCAITKTKSLKFGNCPLAVRVQKDDLSSRNDDASMTDRKDDTMSVVATRKTSFATSTSMVRAKDDDTNIDTNIKSMKLFSPPPVKKNMNNVYNDEGEDSDDDGDDDDDGYIEDDEDEDDDEGEEEEEESDIENNDTNYKEHLSILIKQSSRSIKPILNNHYNNTSTNAVTSTTCNTDETTDDVNTSTNSTSTPPTSYKYTTSPTLTPKSSMISGSATRDKNSQRDPLNNSTFHQSKLISASTMPRKTRSFPPYNISTNVTKVKIDPHPINWNVKKGIPIPQPSMNNMNSDKHCKRRKHHCGEVNENAEDMNDNGEREGLRETRNGEEGILWPISI